MPPGGRIRVELQANSASCCDHQQSGRVKHNSPGMHSNTITAAVVISLQLLKLLNTNYRLHKSLLAIEPVGNLPWWEFVLDLTSLLASQ